MGQLDRAADRLHHAIAARAPLPISVRLWGAIDNFVIGRFMLKPNRGQVYDYIVARWREKGMV